MSRTFIEIHSPSGDAAGIVALDEIAFVGYGEYDIEKSKTYIVLCSGERIVASESPELITSALKRMANVVLKYKGLVEIDES